MHGYYCSICYRDHQMNSRIGKEHYPDYLKERDMRDKEADERRKHEKPRSKEELDQALYKAIYG